MGLNNLVVHSFTIKSTGLNRCIIIPLEIAFSSKGTRYDTAEKTNLNGIWDTGATGTVITKRIVDELKLVPTGITFVNTASESGKQVNTYLVDIYLKKDLKIEGVTVTEGTIGQGIDCLIGMDIINLGDFSITNFNGKTTFSFRIPSLHEIDYYAEAQKRKPIVVGHKQERNEPCDCGSGKKYKHCHGK